MKRSHLQTAAKIILVVGLVLVGWQCSAQTYPPNRSGLTVDGGNQFYQSGTLRDGTHWSVQSGFGSSRYSDSTGRHCISTQAAGSTATSCNQ